MEAATKPVQLTDLTKRLPVRAPYARVIAERLNDRGLLSSYGKPYQKTTVYNVVYGRQHDENVHIELLRLVAEHEGKSGKVGVLLNAAALLMEGEA